MVNTFSKGNKKTPKVTPITGGRFLGGSMTLNLAPSSISQDTYFQNLLAATHSHLDHLTRGLRLLSTASVNGCLLALLRGLCAHVLESLSRILRSVLSQLLVSGEAEDMMGQRNGGMRGRQEAGAGARETVPSFEPTQQKRSFAKDSSVKVIHRSDGH